MDKHEFEQFVTEHGKRYSAVLQDECREYRAWKRTVSGHHGKAVGKAKKLDAAQNIKKLCHADSNPAVESPEDPSQKQAFLKLQIK